MAFKNSSKLLEILKGTKMTESPMFNNVKLKNEKNEFMDRIDSYPILIKAINCNYILSRSCKDILAYITHDNYLKVFIGNDKFISAKLAKNYFEIRICKFSEIYIFLRNEQGTKIYKTVDKKRLEDFATLKHQLEDITMVEGKSNFYCYIRKDNIHDIYCFTITKRKLCNIFVTSYECDYDSAKKRLYIYDSKCYFSIDNRCYNISDECDIIDGDGVYNFNNGQMILKENGENLLITISGSGFTYFIPKIEGMQFRLHNNLLIMHTHKEIQTYKINQNLQLEKINANVEYKEGEIVNSELIVLSKSLIFYVFCKDKIIDKFELTPHPEIISKIKPESSNLHNMIANDKTQTEEKITEPKVITTIIEKDNIENLEMKIEQLILNVENQRKKTEEQSKAKFLQLLEIVNTYMNENLVKGIEDIISQEVRMAVSQIKKTVTDSVNQLNKNTENVSQMVTASLGKIPYGEISPAESNYIRAFKEILTDDLYPIIEACFKEMKLQMLTSRTCKQRLVEEKSVTREISIKDKIDYFLKEKQIEEAIKFTSDLKDDDLLNYFLEKLSISDIENLKNNLVHQLITDAHALYNKNKNVNILRCLCDLLMNLDFNELNKKETKKMLLMFDELNKIVWPNQDGLKLIIRMQRRHAAKKTNKTQ